MENSPISTKLLLTAICSGLSGVLLALPLPPVKTPGASLSMLKAESAVVPVTQTVLKPGVYWGGGSRYLAIAQKANRYCLEGSSSKGMMVASLQPINASGQYQTYQTNWVLQQRGEVLLFDSLEYQPDGELDPSSLSAELKECLESDTDYFQQVWSREAESDVISPEK